MNRNRCCIFLFKTIVCICFYLFPIPKPYAQCPSGKTNVRVVVQPDNLGSETSWSLLNSITQSALNNGGPYADGNLAIITSDYCVDNGTTVTLKLNDSYGDGMCCLQGNGYCALVVGTDTIYRNGNFETADSAAFLIPPVQRDASILSLSVPDYVDTNAVLISGIIANRGTSTISTVAINYQVNNGSIKTMNTALSIPKGSQVPFAFNILWHPVQSTAPVIKTWASLINSAPDQNTSNDTAIKQVQFAERLPKNKILFESFTSTTDTITAFQQLILDSTIARNVSKAVCLNYHVGMPVPGNDPMYLYNSTLNDARSIQYDVNVLPKLVMNGRSYRGLPGNLSQNRIDADTIARGPFDIRLDEEKIGNQISVSVTTMALVPFTGKDLRVYVAFCEDPVSFASAPAPSIKTEFPMVVRALIPGTAGHSIGSPLVGEESTLNQDFTFDPILVDSAKLKTIVFIEEDHSGKIIQVLSGNTRSGYNHFTTSMNENAFSIEAPSFSVKVFPNPVSNKVLHLLSTNARSEGVQIELINMLGESIRSIGLEHQGISDLHTISLPEIVPGIYILKCKTRNEQVCSRIVIQ